MLTALAAGRLLADRTGSTPPAVVALHGWARSGADFAAIVDGLDAVAPHLPGFGTTDAPDSAWGSADYAELVAEAIRGFSSDDRPVRPVVVGHSFGGRVAVRLAAKHPELVSGLVLTGVPLLRLAPVSKPALSFRIARALAKRGILSQKVLERQRRKHGSADYNAAQGVMREIMVKVVNEDYRDDLAMIAKTGLPVRMVWGENDTAAPAEAGRAASQLTGAGFTVVPGAGHLLEGALRDAVRDAVVDLVGGSRAVGEVRS